MNLFQAGFQASDILCVIVTSDRNGIEQTFMFDGLLESNTVSVENPSQQIDSVGSRQRDIKNTESFVKHQLFSNLQHRNVKIKGNC